MLGLVISAIGGEGLEFAPEVDYSMEDYGDYIVLDAQGSRSEEARSRLNDLLGLRAPAPGYEVVNTADGWKLTRPCSEKGRPMKATVDYYDGMWV